MEAKITKSLLNQLKAGEEDIWVWDSVVPGFGLRITPKNARTYWLKYRMAGGRKSTTRKFKLGTHGEMTPDQARTRAEQVLANIRLGVDPGAERDAARQPKSGTTVADVVAEFIQRHASKLRSGTEVRQQFERYVIPRWGERQITDISRRDVIELLDSIADQGHVTTSNRVFAAVRKMFNWCLDRDILSASPCARVKPVGREVSRERVLEDDELRRIWLVAEAIPYPFGPWVRLLILTGQRRDEVAGMRWSEINTVTGLWSLPGERTKNKRPHDVPLTAPILDILASLPRDGSDFAFTTTGKTAISGYSKAKLAMDAKLVADGSAPLPQWGFHDFRRTQSTNLAKLGIPLEVVEKLQNHVSGKVSGVAAVYNRHQYLDERRRALEAWASRLDQIINGTPANVIQLAGTRKTSI